ncbi:NfeD family protein [Roseinatronobacter sp. NSM]|uniref:NfeD family protein n=1 Tax=Roseinatronobacter sp. NSM TaxID=3457785 RepID=UPI00403604A4
MESLGLPDWMIWGIIAVVLLIAEMVTTVYVALGFALAAVAVAGLVWLLPGLPVLVQALIWAALGLVVWLGVSRWNSARHKARPDINDFDSLDSLPPSDRRKNTPPTPPQD